MFPAMVASRVTGLSFGGARALAACKVQRRRWTSTAANFTDPIRAVIDTADKEIALKPLRLGCAFRTRRKWHACYDPRRELVMGTVNVQALSWTKQSCKAELAHMVMVMRERNMALMLVSDLKTPEWKFKSNQVQILCVEEYMLVIYGKVGIMLSRWLVTRWDATGRKLHFPEEGDRWIGLSVRIRGHEYLLQCGYCPTQSPPVQARHTFWEMGTEMLQRSGRSRGKTQILGGDFNSHVGPSMRGGQGVGRHTLITPTSRLGHQLAEFTAENNLALVDSFCPCRDRGTWYNHFNNKWYENDVILCTEESLRQRWWNMKTFSLAGSDHRGKQVSFHVRGRETIGEK